MNESYNVVPYKIQEAGKPQRNLMENLETAFRILNQHVGCLWPGLLAELLKPREPSTVALGPRSGRGGLPLLPGPVWF